MLDEHEDDLFQDADDGLGADYNRVGDFKLSSTPVACGQEMARRLIPSTKCLRRIRSCSSTVNISWPPCVRHHRRPHRIARVAVAQNSMRDTLSNRLNIQCAFPPDASGDFADRRGGSGFLLHGWPLSESGPLRGAPCTEPSNRRH